LRLFQDLSVKFLIFFPDLAYPNKHFIPLPLVFGIERKNFRVGVKQSYFNYLIFALKCIGYSVPAELQFQRFWIAVARGSKGAPNTVLLGKLLLTGLCRA